MLKTWHCGSPCDLQHPDCVTDRLQCISE
jgi:hypothetical protein